VESLGKFPDSWRAEIAGQPDALRRAGDAMVLDQRDRIEGIEAAARSRRRIAFTGMGASYFAGYVPVTTLAGRGVTSIHVDAAELLHFRLPLIGADTVVILVSQSGESAETVAVAEHLRHRAGHARPLLVSVTNGSTNELAGLADIALDTRAGPERGPSTLTFGASLVALAAIVGAIALGDGAPRIDADGVRGAAEAAADAAESLLTADPRDVADGVAAWFGGRPTLLTLGRGGARAASEMGALILKEAARLPAEALEAGQFRHGPLELAGPSLAAFVVATEPATERLDVALAEDLADRGAAVLVAARGGIAPPGRSVRTMGLGAVGPALAPAVAVIPMQLLAWRLSVERGLDPTRLQVASKVTMRE
jgi:glucosamine--fructose-6-phosphate aminotransferase (isomerizing)